MGRGKEEAGTDLNETRLATEKNHVIVRNMVVVFLVVWLAACGSEQTSAAGNAPGRTEFLAPGQPESDTTTTAAPDPEPITEETGLILVEDNPPESNPGTIRLYTYLAYSISEDLEDVEYVFQPDGDVLQVIDGDIYSGPSHYRTWNIGPDGYDQVVAELRVLRDWVASVEPVGSEIGRHASVSSSQNFVLDFQVFGLDRPKDDFTREQLELRNGFLLFLDELDDMDWLENTVVTEPVPWVPYRLTVEVRNEYDTRYYVTEDFEWPFDRTVEEMAGGPIDGEAHICLAGEDAALAWDRLLIDDVNNARIPVTDGVATYEMSLIISNPMYHRSDDPCPGVEAIKPPLPATANPVDLLLFDADDFDEAWTVSPAETIHPPPRVSACGGDAGRSETATAIFDGAMQRRTTAVSSELSLQQIVGEVDDGIDLDAAVEAIAPFDDCAEPFARYGITEFDSGDFDSLPAGVTAAAWWTFRRAETHVAVADLALDGRYAMVISLDSATPIGPDDLQSWIELAAAELAELS